MQIRHRFVSMPVRRVPASPLCGCWTEEYVDSRGNQMPSDDQKRRNKWHDNNRW
jgi:hypothetical protein